MYRPMKGYVVLEPEESEEITETGIITTAEKQATDYAKVVALGDGVFDLKEGDRVFYNRYMGEEFEKRFVVVKPEYIYCIIE